MRHLKGKKEMKEDWPALEYFILLMVIEKIFYLASSISLSLRYKPKEKLK